MRHFLLCVLILVLDVAFALAGAKTFLVPVLTQSWAGVPASTWAGIIGIVLLVLLTVAISLFAFRTPEARR